MKIKRMLEDDEVKKIADACYQDFEFMFSKYVKGIQVREAASAQPEMLDIVRSHWQLDEDPMKPDQTVVTEVLGIAFGMLLNNLLGMKWCEVKSGLFNSKLAMVWVQSNTDDKRKQVFVSPVEFIKKREAIQNAELIAYSIEQMKKMQVEGEIS